MPSFEYLTDNLEYSPLEGNLVSHNEMPPSRTGGFSDNGGVSRRRTSHACDRCRVKKAKVHDSIHLPNTHISVADHLQCDGRSRCTKCVEADSKCTYEMRRGRETRGQRVILHPQPCIFADGSLLPEHYACWKLWMKRCNGCTGRAEQNNASPNCSRTAPTDE